LFNSLILSVQQLAGQDEELERLEEMVLSREHVALAVKEELGRKCRLIVNVSLRSHMHLVLQIINYCPIFRIAE
jgi:hypothetical protein